MGLGVLASIVLPILVRYAFKSLIPLLFNLLVAKYGDGFMGFVLELIADNAHLIELKQLDKDEAERKNVETMIEVSKQSPGLPKSVARWVHSVAYMEYVRRTNPSKFERTSQRVENWFKGNKVKYPQQDFMDLYTSRVDNK